MKVFLTFRNSDTIEGRGPMVPDLCFVNREHAEAYIDEQPGVQGRKQKWSLMYLGDWYVKEVDVIEYDVVQMKRLRERRAEALLKNLDESDVNLLREYLAKK